MGSRLNENPEHLFECFFEVEAPSAESPEPKIVKKFPESYEDEVASKELPKFCFPCDLTRYNPAGQLFTFVLIGLDNNQRFGFCRHPPGAKTCLCILSCLPWFEIFYKVLNTIAEFKYSDQFTAGSKLLDQLYKIDVPLPGYMLTVTVKERDVRTELKFQCPNPKTLPTIPESRNITEFFSALDTNNMMLLFVSLLFERRVLITSEKLSRLTACVHGAASLLYPLYWQHIYIPVMPAHLIDYCCAPMPFLVGVHQSFMPKVRAMALDEVVILNADTNEIENPFNDIESLPQDAVKQLKNNLKNTSTLSGDGVARSFLKAIVALIGGYKDALKLKEGGVIDFDRDGFVQTSRSSSTQQFLEKVLALQHFTQFVDSRVDQMNSGQIPEDPFEEECKLAMEGGSGGFKGILESVRTDGKSLLKDVNKFAQSRMKDAQRKMETIKVPEVNQQAMKQVLNQTKEFANKGLKDMKSKLKGKETEDLFWNRRKQNSMDSLDIPSTRVQTASAPTSPTSSPVIPRRAFISRRVNGDPELSPKHQSVIGMANEKPPQLRKTSSSRRKQYKELSLDPPGQKKGEEAERNEEAKSKGSDMDLMADMQEELKKLDPQVGLPPRSNSEPAVELPVPFPRKKHQQRPESAVLPPPPVAPPRRPRRVPPLPPKAKDIRVQNVSSSSNNSNENLIDIDGGPSLDMLLGVGPSQVHASSSPDISQTFFASKGATEGRVDPLQTETHLLAISPANDSQDSTEKLLRDYGLNFGSISNPSLTESLASGSKPSLTLAPGLSPNLRMANSSPNLQSFNQRHSFVEQRSAPSHQPLNTAYSNPGYEQVFLSSVTNPFSMQGPRPACSPAHTNTKKTSSTSSNPFSPSAFTSNQSGNNNPFSPDAAAAENASDPFADLVSMQRSGFD